MFHDNYAGTPFEVLLSDVEACLRQLVMIYCQREIFHFDELDALARCGIRFNPYMVAERHPLSVWNWDGLDNLEEWVKNFQDEWYEHRDEGRYLEDICRRITSTCFWNLHKMLDKANLASTKVTVEKTDGGGMRLIVEDCSADRGIQKYIVFIKGNKVWVYLDDGRPMEESLDRMNMVCVGHGDSWEEIKEKLNEPDPMTQEELLEAFSSHNDIRDSIAKYPEKVFWPKNMVCKHCGKRIVSLYYESPVWTWEELCGRAGILYICPYCKEDDHFNCEIMN